MTPLYEPKIWIHCLTVNSFSDKLILLDAIDIVAQLVKNLPAMQAILVQALGWEDPLEKGTATHSSILV